MLHQALPKATGAQARSKVEQREEYRKKIYIYHTLYKEIRFYNLNLILLFYKRVKLPDIYLLTAFVCVCVCFPLYLVDLNYPFRIFKIFENL